jgi:hypothetical protein
MGKMKQLCIDIIEANGGIPPGMTIADLARMNEMEVYNWEQYEREQEKARIQRLESENSRKITEVVKAKKTRSDISTTEEEQESEIY